MTVTALLCKGGAVQRVECLQHPTVVIPCVRLAEFLDFVQVWAHKSLCVEMWAKNFLPQKLQLRKQQQKQMKRYHKNDIDGGYTLIIGTDREIRSLYNNLEYHGFYPIFSGIPKFQDDKMYGLILERNNWYYVINADAVIKLMMEG